MALINEGKSEQAIALAKSNPLNEFFARGKAVHAHFLAKLLRTDPRYVQTCVYADPSLIHVRHTFNRTLLHEAAPAGHAEVVELLLRLGADPNGEAHSPLYSCANGCRSHAKVASRIVMALAAAGADINAPISDNRPLPLHMAARRGSVAIAQALLDLGASVNPRDTTGDTPLRRAVNCNQLEVAALLLQNKANPDSPGK